jgi:hypothetical protein
MPKPTTTENEAQFMKRCVPVLIGEGNEQDQAVSVCQQEWAANKRMRIAIETKKAAMKNGGIVTKRPDRETHDGEQPTLDLIVP